MTNMRRAGTWQEDMRQGLTVGSWGLAFLDFNFQLNVSMIEYEVNKYHGLSSKYTTKNYVKRQ